MIVQYTAAALASENKVLAHPVVAPTRSRPRRTRRTTSRWGRPRRATPGRSSATSSRSSRSSCCARPRRSTCGCAAARRAEALRSPATGVAEAHAAGPRAGRRRWPATASPGPDLAAALALVHDGALADLAGDPRVDSRSMAIRIVDVTDDATFALVPPCADPGFDHRSCDYWEDADRGSKAAAPRPGSSPRGRQAPPPAPARPRNPFARRRDDEPAFNPFAPAVDGPDRSTRSRRRRRAGVQPVRARRPRPGPARRRRRAAQAAAARARARGLRRPTRRCSSTTTSRGRLRAVRPAVRLPARHPHPRALPAPARRRRCRP